MGQVIQLSHERRKRARAHAAARAAMDAGMIDPWPATDKRRRTREVFSTIGSMALLWLPMWASGFAAGFGGVFGWSVAALFAVAGMAGLWAAVRS